MATAIPPAASRPVILLVEDDRDLGPLMRAALAGAGHRALLVPGHAAALAALATVRFALVIADTQGPPAGRWANLDRLRLAAGGAPVVICSGHGPAILAGWGERGFAGLLPKPFDLAALLALARAHAAPARDLAPSPAEPGATA